MSPGQRTPGQCSDGQGGSPAGSPATLPVTVNHVSDRLLPLGFDVLQLGQDWGLLVLMAARQEGLSRPQYKVHLHTSLRLQLAQFLSWTQKPGSRGETKKVQVDRTLARHWHDGKSQALEVSGAGFSP